jgi:hypothetical protein
MEWLLAQEVILFLALLIAFGLLVLGTLTLVWATRHAPPAEPGRPRTREPATHRDRVASPPEDRAATAVRLGRMLLDRALQDPDPTSEQRRRLIHRAIACLNRGVEAAPDDDALRETLTTAHAALWTTYQQMGLERLAKERPWRATTLTPGVTPRAR